MKVALCTVALFASASAFTPQMSGKTATTAMQAESGRRQAFGVVAASIVAAIPVVANAAAGESPKFSVFGLIGDGTSYSEGAAYGTDQSSTLYSPYSVYGEQKGSLYDGIDTSAYVARKKAILVESKKRLGKLPNYIARKEWSNVTGELTRYMYETREAVSGLATTAAQKEKAATFFKTMEDTYGAARLKKQDVANAAAAASVTALDAFVASL